MIPASTLDCGAIARSCSRGSRPDRGLTRPLLLLPLDSLVSRPAQGTVPPAAFRSSSRWERDGDAVLFRYEGDDGTLEYRWERPAAGQAQNASMGLFGKIILTASGKGMNAIRVPLASSAQVVWSKPARALEDRWDMTSEGPVLVRTFKVGDVTTTVRIKGSLDRQEPGP